MSIKSDTANVKNLSVQDFLGLGLNRVVYIKPVSIEGGEAFAIQAADGTTIAVEDSLDGATLAVQATDFEAVTLQ